MWAWYNEIDPYAAQWLRNLISSKLITDGEVDERPVQDVKPRDLEPFTRCHFFAGIAGWDLALNRADFPTDQKVWTGSCPCQPFSTAGKRMQFDDERHLWPFWHYLISVCRPPVIFGEQVANGAGAWLDLVFADLESQGYAIGAALLPAAGVGAPHIRNRTWFVAHPYRQGQHGLSFDAQVAEIPESVSDASSAKLWQQSGRRGGTNGTGAALTGEYGAQEHVADASRSPVGGEPQLLVQCAPAERGGWWASEPDVGRVAHGVPNRVGRLRAYGNAIVPQVAAEFIKAYLACRP